MVIGSQFTIPMEHTMSPHGCLNRLAVTFALLAWSISAHAQQPPVVEAVIGNNFGHLPMFVGVEKGLFKKHGLDLKLKVVNTGTDMVSAMTKREVQIGDMSMTTFLNTSRTFRRCRAER
jgi:ABC-type nitrate/sulfonate/bicarbonate transport system substrate-binding protein